MYLTCVVPSTSIVSAVVAHMMQWRHIYAYITRQRFHLDLRTPQNTNRKSYRVIQKHLSIVLGRWFFVFNVSAIWTKS